MLHNIRWFEILMVLFHFPSAESSSFWEEWWAYDGISGKLFLLTLHRNMYISTVFDSYKNVIPLSNSTLFQTSPCFLRVCNTSLLKIQWEKEKLLVTSNFYFSHCVYYPYLESLLPFPSNLKLSSAITFCLEESKFCRLGKG